MEKNINEILSNEAIIIEGYMLPNKLDMRKKLNECFNRENKIVLLTLSAMFIVQFHSEKIIEIANKSDIIVGNIKEAEILSGLKNGEPRNFFENIFSKLVPRETFGSYSWRSRGLLCKI